MLLVSSWWTEGNDPENSEWGPWQKVESSCNRDLDCTDQYSNTEVYHEDDLTCYSNNCFSSTRTT